MKDQMPPSRIQLTDDPFQTVVTRPVELEHAAPVDPTWMFTVESKCSTVLSLGMAPRPGMLQLMKIRACLLVGDL
jgi:hypothetical protein